MSFEAHLLQVSPPLHFSFRRLHSLLRTKSITLDSLNCNRMIGGSGLPCNWGVFPAFPRLEIRCIVVECTSFAAFGHSKLVKVYTSMHSSFINCVFMPAFLFVSCEGVQNLRQITFNDAKEERGSRQSANRTALT